MTEQRRPPGIGGRTALAVAAAALLTAAMIGVAFLGGVASTRPGVAAEPPGSVVNVRMEQGDVTLVCPPAVIDPSGPSAIDGDPGLWNTPVEGLAPVALDGGGAALTVPSDALGDSPFVAVSGTAAAAGDLASLLAESCVRPGRELVLPGGATEVGEDSVLILSNPGAKTVTATVQVLTPIGPGLAQPFEITIPPQSTVLSLPAIWAPGEAKIGLRVLADGAGVGAWLQSSGLQGEVPQGLGRIEAAAPNPTQVIVGLDSMQAQTLRVANVGTEATPVEVTVLGTDSITGLGGTEGLSVQALGVFDIDVTGLPADALALVVTAEQPIAAAIHQQAVGTPFPEDPALDVQLRSFVPSAQSFQAAGLVPLTALRTIAGAFGFSDLTADIVLANPADQAIDADVGGTELRLPESSVITMPLDALEGDPAVVAAGAPIYGALVVRAIGASGRMTSVLPLHQDIAGLVEQQVRVLPSYSPVGSGDGRDSGGGAPQSEVSESGQSG